MTQTSSAAAFLPFLKKKPLPTAAPKEEQEEDPLALPIPPAPKPSQLSNARANAKFVSKLNGKTGSGHAAAGSRATPPSKNRSIAASTKQSGARNGAANKPAAKPSGAAPAGRPGAPPAKPILSAAEAKAEAERRRLRQLQRLAKLGALNKDAAPEVLAKIEAAKQQAAAIQRQQELEAKRKADLERRKKQLELQRQQQEQERQRILAEKQRLQASKLGKPLPPGTIGAKPAAGAGAAAAAGPGRGTSGGAPGPAGSRTAAATAAGRDPGGPGGALGGARPPGQQSKDPYEGLNPKQKAFLLARQREREMRMAGRAGGSRPVRSSYGSDDEGAYFDDDYDDLDDFIEDDMGGDWRKELRRMTGYDPSRYKDSFYDDRRMEASAAEIQAEERRSARIGRTEDEREAEAEARRLAAKEAKKKGKKRGAAALFDD